MQPILISACLLGHKVRYNGSDVDTGHALLAQWKKEGRAVALCPEMAGGLPTPRPAAEITAAGGGAQVLSGLATVRVANGDDVTLAFVAGAQQALAMVKAKGIRVAVLKEGSPSCGSAYTYDGSFTGNRTELPGVTAALLLQNGIAVFSEHQLDEAQAFLLATDADR
jgi:uncharacterized protein YbbK (DUF523 family)